MTATSPSMRPRTSPAWQTPGHGPGLRARRRRVRRSGWRRRPRSWRRRPRRSGGPGSWTARAARPWTAERVGMRATRTPSARACSAAAPAACAQLGVVGQQHDLAGVRAADGGGDLAAGRAARRGGRRRRSRRPRRTARPGRRRATTATTAGAGRARVAGRRRRAASPKWVIRMRCGRPASMPASTAAPDVVDVDVDVPQPVAADHDQGVAERVEPAAQRARRRRRRGLQQVDHLEGRAAAPAACASAAGAVLGRGVRAVGAGARARKDVPARRRCPGGPAGLAGDGLAQRAEHGDQAEAAGVDDAGPAQHAELARGARRARRGAPAWAARTTSASAAVGVAAAASAARGGDGEHGALDRVGDRLVRRSAAARQRSAQRRPAPAAPARSAASASFMPRSSWARIVPELPRAPIRAPCDIARNASGEGGRARRGSAGARRGRRRPLRPAWAADSTVR